MAWPKGKSRAAANAAARKEEAPEIPTLDPADITAAPREHLSNGDDTAAAEPAPKARRTRRPRAPAARETINPSALEALLLSVHAGIAAILRAPSVALDPMEAKQLAIASSNVMRHYDVPGLSEKVVDWTNLFGTLGIVYGPRIMASMEAKRQARSAARPAPTGPNNGKAPEPAPEQPALPGMFAPHTSVGGFST